MKTVFLRVSMIILGILLCANILVTFLGSPSTSYAAKNFQYKVLGWKDGASEKSIETDLNQLGSQGWEVATAGSYFVILKK